MMKNKLALFGAGAVALLVLPLFAQYFGDGWVRILDAALLYMMLALGLTPEQILLQAVGASET